MGETVNINAANFLYESLHGEKPPENFFVERELLSHADLVTIGARWLRYYKNCQIVVEEPASATFIKPDVIGFQSIPSFMIEVKVSRADFFADQKKKHFGSRLAVAQFYLTPPDLVKPDEVPDGYGLIEAPNKSWKNIITKKDAPWIYEGVSDQIHKMIFYTLLTNNKITGHFRSGKKIGAKWQLKHKVHSYI